MKCEKCKVPMNMGYELSMSSLFDDSKSNQMKRYWACDKCKKIVYIKKEAKK
jgi:hypothetical protein